MDYRNLKYIVAIAEYQNLTKAAEALYVGQPTLSKSLAAIEDKLGLKLFRKVGRAYLPTYAGECYIKKAREILGLYDSLDAEMSDILKQNAGELSIAFANMRCGYMLPIVLPAFQRQYPNVKVNVFEGSSDDNDRRLLDGAIEVAFYTKPSALNDRIEYMPLASEELLICIRKGHPAGRFSRENPHSRYPKLDLDVLKDELVLMMRPEQRTRQIVESILREADVHFDNVLYTSNLQAIMGLVAAGYGVSFVFDSHLKHRGDAMPIDCYSFGNPRTSYDFVAAKRKGAYLSRHAKAFIEIVRDVQLQDQAR